MSGACKLHSRPSGSRTTISRVRREFAAAGLGAIERRRPQVRRPPKLDGAQEAHLIALTCSAPPKGHARWTLRLLADKGPGEFYRGEIAQAILKTSNSLGGTMQAGDLAEFASEWVDPISIEYRGWKVY